MQRAYDLLKKHGVIQASDVEDIVKAIDSNFTIHQLLQNGISTHPKNYKRYIVPLLEKGLLSMTLPDKPNSKNQKYITTEKGKVFLNKKDNMP